jgi:hypothetical protein
MHCMAYWWYLLVCAALPYDYTQCHGRVIDCVRHCTIFWCLIGDRGMFTVVVCGHSLALLRWVALSLNITNYILATSFLQVSRQAGRQVGRQDLSRTMPSSG